MFQINQAVTVDPTTGHAASAHQYNATHGEPEGTPVPATIVNTYDTYSEVRYPDGASGTPLNVGITAATPPLIVGAQVWPASDAQRLNIEVQTGDPITWPARVATVNATYVTLEGTRGNQIFRERFTTVRPNPYADLLTPDEQAAPVAPVDPLEVWEAGLADSEAVRAAIWEAADQAACTEEACSEYEATVAHPHGHSGREGYEPEGDDDDDEHMGAGEVTYRRTVTRTYTITQEATVEVEAGADAYETMREEAEWEDIDTDSDYDDQEDDYGPEEYNNDRESIGIEVNDEQTMPAALVRAALYTTTPYRLIRDAILATAAEHGAPVSKTSTVGIAAYISRPDAGAWTAPAQERLDDQPVAQWQADSLSNTRTWDAYEVARNLFERDGLRARIAHGTLAAVVKSEWEVTA